MSTWQSIASAGILKAISVPIVKVFGWHLNKEAVRINDKTYLNATLNKFITGLTRLFLKIKNMNTIIIVLTVLVLFCAQDIYGHSHIISLSKYLSLTLSSPLPHIFYLSPYTSLLKSLFLNFFLSLNLCFLQTLSICISPKHNHESAIKLKNTANDIIQKWFVDIIGNRGKMHLGNE